MNKYIFNCFLIFNLIVFSNGAIADNKSNFSLHKDILQKSQNHLQKTTKFFNPILSRAKNFQQKPERDILGLRNNAEKRRIEEKRKNYQLNYDYCLMLSNFENFKYCTGLLKNQEDDCNNSIIKGSNIYIDLGNQVLYAVKNCDVIVYTRIISGKNSTPSPTGNYKIYEKRGAHWMQGEWFVNMSFYFRGGFAIHDAGWRQGIYWKKENRGYYGSHGCINMPKEAMDILWNNFSVGDGVHLYYHLPNDIAEKLNQKIADKEIIDPMKEL